jgi:thiosulfate/3-mercaptopyruvate sulfurtransferase
MTSNETRQNYTVTGIPFIVTAEWLRDHSGQKNIKIFDASSHLPTTGRDAQTEFIAQHIAGAGRYDINVIADTSSPLPHTLPSSDVFEAHMRALGLNDDDHIIVYCNSAILSAARAWWMLRLFGHTKVSVLNGGLKSWIAIGGSTDSGPETPVSRGSFTIRPAAGANVINLANLKTLVMDNIAGQIADARSAGRFAGTENEPRAGLRSGHIPGSSNVPISSLLKDGALKDKENLAAAFARAGIDINRPVITSCGTGVTACGLALALAILGNEQTIVYDGSWTEWGASDAPVETGPPD